MKRDWFYLSFADSRRPKGTQFLGGCYVRIEPDPATEAQAMIFAIERRGDGTTLDEDGMGVALAIARTHKLGINPGGEARVLGPLTDEQMDEYVPEGDRERLLTKEELERV